MRRILAFGLAWLVAAVVATVVAWQGVGLIGHQVTSRRPATLSAGDIETTFDSTTTDRPSTTAPGRSTTTGLGAGTTAPSPATSGAGTTAASSGGTGAGSGTAVGGGSTAPADHPAPTPAPAPVKPIVRTYKMKGGTAAIQFTPTKVTVLYATPNPGYQARTGDGDNGGVRVEFDGSAGTSRVDAWWAGGPQARVRESSSGGGGGGGGGGGDG